MTTRVHPWLGALTAVAVLATVSASRADAPIVSWSKVTVATAPPSSNEFTLVFDGRSATSLLFGGEGYLDSTSSNATPLNSLWSWDGATWSKLCTSNPCAAGAPPPRSSHAMAYDAVRDVTILFGGWALDSSGSPTAVYADTWEWNGSAWSEKCNGSCSSLAPNEVGASMAFDSARGQAVLFGGESCEPATCKSGSIGYDATWLWNGTKWDVACTPPSCTAPPNRVEAAMAFDAARGKMVLFGGVSDGNVLGDTWEWDGASWTEVCTSAPCSSQVPAARHSHSLAYDSARQRVVLFGGCDFGCATIFQDTWEWDGGAWSQTATTPSLVTEGEQAMVYDAARRRVVLVNGGDAGAVQTMETWEYSAEGETCGKDTDCDTGHCVDSVCCATDCSAVCSSCSLPATRGICTPMAGCSGACTGHILQAPDGNEFDCSPYECASGACATTCKTADDCVSPNVCDPAGKCIAPPNAGSASSGCTTGAASGGPIEALLVAAIVAAFCRRRRSIATETR
jgi:MYXO-CTERM domain-containing protein